MNPQACFKLKLFHLKGETSSSSLLSFFYREPKIWPRWDSEHKPKHILPLVSGGGH